MMICLAPEAGAEQFFAHEIKDSTSKAWADLTLMSLRCPKCGGLVYARSNRKCGRCGADLPVDFIFTKAEAAAEIERANGQSRSQRPHFPSFVIFCWLMIAGGWSYLAVIHVSRVEWSLAGLWIAAAIERYLRFTRLKKQYGQPMNP